MGAHLEVSGARRPESPSSSRLYRARCSKRAARGVQGAARSERRAASKLAEQL